MKTIIRTSLFTIFLLVNININAQDAPVRFGIKTGVNISNFNGDIEDNKAKSGFNAGITLDCAIAPGIYIMTGIDFITKGAKVDLEETIAILGTEAKATIKGKDKSTPMYIQIPLHMGHKLEFSNTSRLVIHAGSYIAYGVSGKNKIETKINTSGSLEGVDISEYLSKYKESYEADFFGDKGIAKRFDFGFGLGMGVEFGNFNMELGYDLGLVNIAKTSGSVMIGEEEFKFDPDKIRNMSAYFNIGYKF